MRTIWCKTPRECLPSSMASASNSGSTSTPRSRRPRRAPGEQAHYTPQQQPISASINNMDNSNSSARRTLLPFDRIEFNAPVQSRQARWLPDSQNFSQNLLKVRTIEQERKMKLAERLKDKSMVLGSKPLGIHERLMLAMDSRFSVIHPESRVLLLWNFVVIISILLHLFEVPLSLFLTEAVYESERNSAAGVAVNTVTLLLMLVDMLLVRVNIAYYQKGKLINSRISILKNYVSFQFWVDLLSNLSLIVYMSSGNPKFIYVKIIFYIKIYTFVKIDQEIMHSLELHRVVYAIYRLTRMIVFVWFLTTWAGCIFFAIDYHFYLDPHSPYRAMGQLWLTNTAAVGNLDLIQNFSWDVWYDYALYWAIQTSSTVGYGDLTPMNPPEVFYCNLVILLMTVLFAFFINSIWEIIGTLQQSSVQYSDNWQNLKVFLGETEIPSKLKQKLSDYLYEVWLDNDNSEIEQLLNEKLSDDLRNEFYLQSRSCFFKQVPLFYEMTREICNANYLIQQFAYQLTELKLAEGDIVYEAGHINPYLFYLRKGSIKLEIEGSNLGRQVGQSSIFGVEEFFVEKPRTHSAQAIHFSKLWQLSHDDMMVTLRKDPNIYNKYCQLRDKIILQKSALPLKIECWKCGSNYHFLSNCPIVNSWRNFLEDPPCRPADQASFSSERRFESRRNLLSQKVIQRQGNWVWTKKNTNMEKVWMSPYYFKLYNL